MIVPRRSPTHLRIALVVGTLGRGGTETQLCRLARELTARGHSVRVFAVLEGGPLEETLRADGIPFEIISFPGFWYRHDDGAIAWDQVSHCLRSLHQFWWSLVRFRPHVCHSYLPLAYMVATPIAFAAGTRVRITARRSLPSRTTLSRRYQVLHRWSTRLANAVVANSTAVAEDTRRVEPAAANKMHIIENGVDVPTSQADVSVQPAEAVVLANLIAYKGHADLVEALYSMQRPPLVRFLGDGPERESLERAVREAGLKDRVEFVGRVSDAGMALAKAQFAIHPSHEEGLPNAVLEEMSWGLPIVATSVGGVVELVTDEQHGLLVEPECPEQLARAVDRIMTDPDLRLRLGSAARARAAEFGWMRCTERHLDFYRQVFRHPRRWQRAA